MDGEQALVTSVLRVIECLDIMFKRIKSKSLTLQILSYAYHARDFVGNCHMLSKGTRRFLVETHGYADRYIYPMRLMHVERVEVVEGVAEVEQVVRDDLS